MWVGLFVKMDEENLIIKLPAYVRTRLYFAEVTLYMHRSLLRYPDKALNVSCKYDMFTFSTFILCIMFQHDFFLLYNPPGIFP